jgi:AI-2 transport protein TqsA
MPVRSLTVAAVLISIYIMIQFLWYSQSILIPFIFAVLIWNLLRTIASSIRSIPQVGRYVPQSIAILSSFALVFFIFLMIGQILTENVQSMVISSGHLQNNLNLVFKKIALAGIDKAYMVNLVQDGLKQLNLQGLLVNFYSSISNFMSSLFLITLFVIFFFIEQVFFNQKIAKLFVGEDSREKAYFLLTKIPQEIQRYLGLKTLFSMLTGGVIYLVMKMMGLDYAEFWGVSIFLLNFIPNIGALVITVIITLFAYFQWLDSTKVFVFLGIQIFVHAFIGNFLETHFLGRTMHLSPLFLLLALSFWGTLWGGMGLFLAVPMTVLMMIVLSSFEKTRFWAILMSENGELPHDV